MAASGTITPYTENVVELPRREEWEEVCQPGDSQQVQRAWPVWPRRSTQEETLLDCSSGKPQCFVQ